MMGAKRIRQSKLFYYSLNLEERVRKDNPLRQVQERVDFSFVRESVREKYGYNGHQSEDPIVVLKLMFLLFFEGIKSERELMRMVPERLDYLWFLGMDLEDGIPDHSVLSKARVRWGQELFRELFVRIVWQCVQAGLVEGEKIHVDGSLVDANASAKSILVGPVELIQELKRVYGEQERKLELVEEEEKRSGYRKKNQEMVSKTDPEAAIVKKRGRESKPRYKHHRAVDDQCGVITAVETTSGDEDESHRLMPLMRQHEKSTGRKVATVVADAQYGTYENFARCGARGIRAHMADLQKGHKKRIQRRGLFGGEQFRYDEEEDCYWCPANQRLRKLPSRTRKQFNTYRISGRICNQCPLKSQCTRSKSGRRVSRHVHHELISKARAQSESLEALRDRRRRKHLMEGSFADAANNHGFKQARWRGLAKQEIQDLLIAACQNVRILLRRGGPKASLGATQAAPFPKKCPQIAYQRLKSLFGALSGSLSSLFGVLTGSPLETT